MSSDKVAVCESDSEHGIEECIEHRTVNFGVLCVIQSDVCHNCWARIGPECRVREKRLISFYTLKPIPASSNLPIYR